MTLRPRRLGRSAAACAGIACFVGSVAVLGACARYPVAASAPPARVAAAVATLRIPDDAAVLVGAGDIASCKNLAPAEATAALVEAVVDAVPSALVLTLGDHTYPEGAREEYERCYEPTWGPFNSITLPTPGNHDSATAPEAPYYEYFELFDERPDARSRGWYAFDVGTWRIVALSSVAEVAPGSPQMRWLADELASNARECLLAYWHHPLFSSGFHGRLPWDRGRDTVSFWRALLPHGADVILNGHDHIYERYARQDERGRAAADGAREFVVGTGGAGLHRAFGQRARSEVVSDDVFGVLILVLAETSYEWAFLGTDGAIHDRSPAPEACGAA